MDYKQLSASDLKISRLGLGGIPLQRYTASEVASLLSAARQGGINFIDTARGYGASEVLIGQGLASQRNSFILASKSMQRNKDGILADVQQSLKNLSTDYLDIYQLHNVRTQAEWDQVTSSQGALTGLQEAQKAGLIRYIGITSHSGDMMAKALDSGLFTSMMLPYNVVENQNKSLFAKARKKNVFTLAMKPLAGGFIPKAGFGLRYLAGDPSVDCLLVGMGSPQEIEVNIRALEQGPLNPEESRELDQWASQAGQDFCRRCGYCLPCPQGIDIPVVFLLEGYYDRYELQGWAQERYQAMSVPASVCQECGQCKERCPYDLPIANKLAKASAKLSGSKP